MTDQELHDKLVTDPAFAASFVVQNNFEAVKQKMSELGITVQDPKQAFDILMTWSASGKDGARKQINYVCNVPYINDAPNSTGGYQNFFSANTTNEQRQNLSNGGTKGKVDWATAALAFATTGIGGVIPFLIGQNGSDNTGKTPEEIAAEQKAAEEAAKQAQQRKMFFIIGGSITGVLILGGVLYFVLRSPDSSTKTA